MKINAVAVTSSDLNKSAEFYKLLGFSFPDFKADEQHLEADSVTGSAKLMIDTKKMIKDILGENPLPANHSSFAIEYNSPVEIDTVVKKIAAAGFAVVKQPWNAFWGQRYAIVADPDGYKVDLYAELSSKN